METERLILRPWQESDAEECFKYACDPRIGYPCGFKAHTDVENTRQVIRDILIAPETYAIVLKETGMPVGSIGLHFDNGLAKGEREAELGYWLGVPYWGKGLVPEAAREMLRHAFCDLGLSLVYCAYFEGNEKSKRVQEKLGFRYLRTNDKAYVSQLDETRVSHISVLTKEDFEALKY